MTWFILALLSPAIYVIVNYIDKYVIERKVKDYRGMPIYGALTGIVIGTLFWIFSGQPVLSLRDASLVVTSGVISLFAYYLYFSALSKSQTSIVIILFQMTPIFTLILASIFLKELITVKQLFGFLLVILAAVALSMEGKLKEVKISSAFYLILLADVLLAVSALFIKFTINANSFSKIFSYESWGLALGGLILYIFSSGARTAFRVSFRSVGRNVLGIMFLNESIFVVSKSIQFLAIALGPVALVSVLGSTEVFYGILYGQVLTSLFSHIFKEDVSKKGLLKKLLPSLVLLLGVYLIS